MAASVEQTKVLSTPKILWDGRVIKIVPNSFEYAAGGEAKVRAMSAGGSTVQLVVGVNVEEMITTGKFSIALTKENSDFVDYLTAKRVKGQSSTLRVVEETDQKAWQEVYCTNKPTRKYEAEGSIEIEWAGNMVL